MKAVSDDGRRRARRRAGARRRRRRAADRPRPRRGRGRPRCSARSSTRSTAGELAEARLREAAARVARVGALGAPAHERARRGRRRGRTAAAAGRSSTEGDVALDGAAARRRAAAARRTSPPARPSTRSARCSPSACRARESVVLDEAAAPDAAALAERAGARLVVVVRDAHRHRLDARRGRALLAAPTPIVVELGLPAVAARRRARLRRRRYGGSRVELRGARRPPARAGARCAHDDRPGSSSSSASSPTALARLLERQGAHAQRARRALPPRRRPLPPDRLARQLVERGALRAVPARPREPRAGRVRDAVALHAVRAAAAARRRARDRHLAVGRVARRPRRDRRGAPSGPADDRDHEPARTRRSARAAEAVLPLEAGEELAVAATKTYLNSLGAIALLFAASTRDDAARCASCELMPGRIAAQLARSFADAAALDDVRRASTAARSSRAASTTARRSRSR